MKFVLILFLVFSVSCASFEKYEASVKKEIREIPVYVYQEDVRSKLGKCAQTENPTQRDYCYADYQRVGAATINLRFPYADQGKVQDLHTVNQKLNVETCLKEQREKHGEIPLEPVIHACNLYVYEILMRRFHVYGKVDAMLAQHQRDLQAASAALNNLGNTLNHMQTQQQIQRLQNQPVYIQQPDYTIKHIQSYPR
jgi:uncharacterized protein YxeA